MDQVTPPGTQVVILDLKKQFGRGQASIQTLHCTLRRHDNGELIISAKLDYVLNAIKERKFELVDAQDVFIKVGEMTSL